MKLLRWMLAGLLLSLAGCAALPETDDLEVSLVSVRPGEVTPWETTGYFTVRLQNAGIDALVLEGGAHKIYLNGTYVGQGLTSERVEVPRLGTTTQEITVHLKNFTLARKLYAASQTLQASYRVGSTLYAAAPGGGRGRTIRATKEGSIDLHEFVPAAERGGSAPVVAPEIWR